VKRGVKQASTELPADTGGARTTNLLIGAGRPEVPKVLIYRPEPDPATGFIKCAYRMDCAVPATEGPTSSC
jgi:hypothetical protein